MQNQDEDFMGSCMMLLGNEEEFLFQVFIFKDQLLRGSLSMKGEVERREELLVGMFETMFSTNCMSLPAQQNDYAYSVESFYN